MQRRRYFRIATSISPRRVIALGDSTPHIAAEQLTIIDLSGGGLLAHVQGTDLTVGHQLRVSGGRDGEPIDVNAVVSWTRSPRNQPGSEVGMRFEVISPQAQIAILDHIRRNQIRAVG